MAESRVLTPEECAELLRGGIVGRVAIASSSGPHIIPVNYSIVDDSIVFRTTPYSVIGTYARDTLAAFEVDFFDYADQRGWSVVARGRCDAIADHHEVEQIRAGWPPRPWADGARNLYVRLRWTELTGRRLGDGWTRDNEMPVRRAWP
jgi:nitroimidazol reductase NimA-like FMN-containing flavoprotein (pyridoxamine 5'-phosphate oxidase superfamily)